MKKHFPLSKNYLLNLLEKMSMFLVHVNLKIKQIICNTILWTLDVCIVLYINIYSGL